MIVEDRVPDPALAGQGPLVDELFAMLAFAEPPPAAGSDEPGSRPLWDYLVALDRRDEFMTGWDRFFASCDVLLAPGDADVRLGGGRGGRRRQPANAGRCGPDAVAGQRLPMIVIPAGTDNNGVPFAVQLIGPRWQAAAGSDGGQGSLRVVTGVSICAPEDVTVGPAGRRRCRPDGFTARRTAGAPLSPPGVPGRHVRLHHRSRRRRSPCSR